jgi:tRNA (mo5U34)-methyltransferase
MLEGPSVAGRSPDELLEASRRGIGWFHSIDFGGGRYTRGHKSPERMHAENTVWQIPEDFTGKTVLDIGCADGGRSILALQRGAASVLSIDNQETSGMRFLLDNNVFPRLEFRPIELFSGEFMALPQFDVVIFTGVLYHVQDMLDALKRVRAKTRELVIIETHINERLGNAIPCAIYYENGEFNGDPTN